MCASAAYRAVGVGRSGIEVVVGVRRRRDESLEAGEEVGTMCASEGVAVKGDMAADVALAREVQ